MISNIVSNTVSHTEPSLAARKAYMKALTDIKYWQRPPKCQTQKYC